MHLVESDAEAQRALTHLTNIGTQDALGVMCLGELSKQGSVCFALVRCCAVGCMSRSCSPLLRCCGALCDCVTPTIHLSTVATLDVDVTLVCVDSC